jgi:hypothetical protein
MVMSHFSVKRYIKEWFAVLDVSAVLMVVLNVT